MIFDILLPELSISLMATIMSPRDWLATSTFRCDAATVSAADSELSVFRRAITLISSVEAEVSSSDAACSAAA